MSITFSSCFYILKSKFDKEKYIEWMNNFISIVNNFNLVIYTDQNSCKYIETRENKNIKIVIKELSSFYNYKYKDYWINNHKKNSSLNRQSPFDTDWQLNMLWCEKVWFVNETFVNQYFDTEYYGWCDIGYFRNRNEDINTQHLQNWCRKEMINNFNENKIHYACIQNNNGYLSYLKQIINNRNLIDLPKEAIPPNQQSVGGGFFIIHFKKIEWWAITFDIKLNAYLKNGCLVKDDQIIIIDCIFTYEEHFSLYREKDIRYDNWFMFQRILY